MKKKYKIILILLLYMQVGWSQLENANWYFGDHAGLNFNGVATVLFDGQTNNIHRETASISDRNGNLLFYTDGITVWNKNHNIMQGGDATLNGGDPLIVPYPNHNNLYFVITSTQVGYSDIRNYYYSIIDMQANNGLGMVTQLNIDLGISALNKALIAKHSDSSSYWFITLNNTNNYGGKFECYKIDMNGFSNNAIVSDIDVHGNYPFFPTYYSLAISNDDSKIALFRFEEAVSTSRINSSSNWDDINIFIFDINRSSGIINLSNYAMLNTFMTFSKNSIEFSEAGNLLYLIGIPIANHSVVPEFFQIDANNLTITMQTNAYHVPAYWHSLPCLSRAIDGKIYVTQSTFYDYGSSQVSYDFAKKLSVINNPNNIGTNCNFVMDQIDLGDNIALKLPRLIPIHECIQDLVITQNVNSGQTDIQESSNTITLQNVIFSGATAEYDAGQTVYLKPNFHAKYGSNFRAYIDGCQGATYLRCESNISYNTNLENRNKDVNKEVYIKVFPNPTKGILKIKTTEEVKNWKITNVYGNSYFKGRSTKTIDVSNLPKGIYVLKAMLNNGRVIINRIIKE